MLCLLLYTAGSEEDASPPGKYVTRMRAGFMIPSVVSSLLGRYARFQSLLAFLGWVSWLAPGFQLLFLACVVFLHNIFRRVYAGS